jgi:enamine deaminase RidA (YjgF/YER057c/UK114 family)
VSDVVFVRAYLAPGPDGKVDFAGWNAAWTETFGTAAMPIKPARSTIAVPLLGNPATLIEVEYVAAAEPTTEGLFASSDKGGLPAGNAMLKPYGTKEGRIASGMGILPGAGLYWSAGTLGAVAKADAPPLSPERFGDTKTQSISTLKRLQENLANVGLSFKDVIFLRAFVAPDATRDGKFDTAGWNAAYDEFFNNPTQPSKPARATVTTPTYGPGGVTIEVEVLAAFPGAPDATKVPFDASKPATQNPNLKAYGPAQSPISSGVAMKPGSGLFFAAGVVPSVQGDMKTQALSAMETLEKRLTAAGYSFKDVTFLRAYLVSEGTNIDRAGWGEAYNKYFNNATQPQKPARTSIAVHSLPGNWKIEIDVIAVKP